MVNNSTVLKCCTFDFCSMKTKWSVSEFWIEGAVSLFHVPPLTDSMVSLPAVWCSPHCFRSPSTPSAKWLIVTMTTKTSEGSFTPALSLCSRSDCSHSVNQKLKIWFKKTHSTKCPFQSLDTFITHTLTVNTVYAKTLDDMPLLAFIKKTGYFTIKSVILQF